MIRRLTALVLLVCVATYCGTNAASVAGDGKADAPPPRSDQQKAALAGPQAFIFFDKCEVATPQHGEAVPLVLLAVVAPKLIDLAITGIGNLLHGKTEDYTGASTALAASQLWTEADNGKVVPGFRCINYVRGVIKKKTPGPAPRPYRDTRGWTKGGLDYLGVETDPTIFVEFEMIASSDGTAFRLRPILVDYAASAAAQNKSGRKDLLITGIFEGAYVGETSFDQANADAAGKSPTKAPTPSVTAATSATPGATSRPAGRPSSRAVTAPPATVTPKAEGPAPGSSSTAKTTAQVSAQRFGAFQLTLVKVPIGAVLEEEQLERITTHWMPMPQSQLLQQQVGDNPKVTNYVPFSLLVNIQETEDAPSWLLETSSVFDSSKDDLSKALQNAVTGALQPSKTPTAASGQKK